MITKWWHWIIAYLVISTLYPIVMSTGFDVESVEWQMFKMEGRIMMFILIVCHNYRNRETENEHD